jgi:hypothetical protein
MTAAGLPVPPGFVVTTKIYREFIESAGIDSILSEESSADSKNDATLEATHEFANELITETVISKGVREEILDAYRSMCDSESCVAVRSSVTAEEPPDGSSGLETFLNVTEEELINSIRECWALLFSQRAIHYRNQKELPHDEADIAVVVQTMVNAEKSGAMFTSHPSTGGPRIIIEAAWGLGDAYASGAVSPDNYVVDGKTGEIEQLTVATKRVMHVKDDATGGIVELEVPEDKRNQQVLTRSEITRLIELAKRIEAHNPPQNVEWCIVGGDVYMVQSDSITTLNKGDYGKAEYSIFIRNNKTVDGQAILTPSCKPADERKKEQIPQVETVRSPRKRKLSQRDLTITDEIGSGGQAVINKARLPDGKQPPAEVALREPKSPSTLPKKAVEELLQQAEAWETIDARERNKQRWDGYEFIVGVISTGEQQPWIAIECMEGGDLDELLNDHTDGLPIGQALWLGECVCKGLEIAHNLGCAHLDVKPENVLLKHTNRWPWPKLADWGLARVLTEEVGSMEALSVEYAAPEQFDSAEFGDPDQLTDIY